jgi:hypothetical protein
MVEVIIELVQIREEESPAFFAACCPLAPSAFVPVVSTTALTAL